MQQREEGSAMPKCEHNDDYIKLHDTLKDHIGMVEKALDGKIVNVDRKADAAFRNIDAMREDLDEQGRDHIETATYVKQLYKRFDELAIQMSQIVTKLDTYITTMATVRQETSSNAAFNKRGKDLVYEIIKWLVLMGLGAALFRAGTP